MNSKEQTIPTWFKEYKVYDEGAVVTNPWSKQSYELNALELSIYDMIIGLNEIIQSHGGPLNPETGIFQSEMAKGLSWFRKHNPDAYMILLD